MKAILQCSNPRVLYLWPEGTDIPGGKEVEVSEWFFNRVQFGARNFNDLQAELRAAVGDCSESDESQG